VPRPHQKPEGNLRCVECGREQPAGEPGWKAYLTVDDEPAEAVFYCPACAASEFGGGTSSAD
jgi:hypothetical protein